ncbi:MAG TPA: gliding motility protein GldM [Flavobacteriales bacterium]|nr:gliding motility protein GldM [Flavobacteriales bacterium]
MAGGKLSPRQKMINMMYLVLTALLALNVSKEILDSFITVNNGLENTKTALAEKANETYTTFANYAQQNAEKYGKAYASAQEVQKLAGGLINYMDSLKVKVIMACEKLPADKIIAKDAAGRDTVLSLQYLNKKDSYNEITNLMVGSEPAKPKEGPWSATELRTKLEAFRDKVKAVGEAAKEPAIVASVDRMFNFEDRRDAGGTMNNWQSINFYHVPQVAGITIMSKIQADVRNMETEMVAKLLGNVEKTSFKFNTLDAIVKPQSSYVTTGSKYRAEIFLGAYDNQNAPEVYICGPGAKVDTSAKVPSIIGESIKLPMEGAKAILEQVAAGAGLRQVSGIIKFTPVGGEPVVQPFTTEYEVAAPNLVVSPTKMNVFYRGIDNPVDISVAGYSAKDISPSMNNGSLTKAAQGYVVRPGSGPDATVGVSVTNPDGTKKSLPGVQFRVKDIPKPQPFFGGKTVTDQSIKKTELTASGGVIAKLENFQFDLTFQIVEYTVSATLSGSLAEERVTGAAMTSKAKEIVGKVKTGQKVYIENIKAKGPDGRTQSIGTLAFKVM